MDIAGNKCGNMSADTGPSHESSHCIVTFDIGGYLAKNVGPTFRKTMLPQPSK